MSKSNTLRRIFLLVLLCVLLFALLTLSIYSLVSPHIFAQAKQTELYPRAQFLAEQASAYFTGGDTSQFRWLFGMDSRQWGATVYLIDKDRNVIGNTDQSVSHSEFSLHMAGFEERLQGVLNGEAASYYSYVPSGILGENGDAANLLFVGEPIWANGEVAGAVVMVKSLEEIVSSMSSLSTALWLSALTVMVIMTPLVYWFALRIAKPMRQMCDVATRMAGGDFSIRANANEPGEIGNMARALNHLSSELGNTITALTRERNQAIKIVHALGEGVMSVDAEGLPMMTNPALQTILLAAGDGKASPLPKEVWEEFRIALKEKRCTDSTFLMGDLLIRLNVTPIDDEMSGSVGAIGVFHDETQAHRLEQTRREYVANVSHELRTPLTALRALIEPLRDGLIRTEDKRQETYNIILRETMRLNRLVDDMLELSRLQSGRLALEKVRFKVETFLRETASTYAAKAATTGHQLILAIEEEPLPTVLGNPDRTEQVLISLLNNAFTYTPAGCSITLRARLGDECLLISVEDNGPGIRSEDLPHVFERFYKADKSHGGSTGTGLGLAIAKELMDRLGEALYVENNPHGGAKFTFTLHYQ